MNSDCFAQACFKSSYLLLSLAHHFGFCRSIQFIMWNYSNRKIFHLDLCLLVLVHGFDILLWSLHVVYQLSYLDHLSFILHFQVLAQLIWPFIITFSFEFIHFYWHIFPEFNFYSIGSTFSHKFAQLFKFFMSMSYGFWYLICLMGGLHYCDLLSCLSQFWYNFQIVCGLILASLCFSSFDLWSTALASLESIVDFSQIWSFLSISSYIFLC